MAENTRLGWILSGTCTNPNTTVSARCNTALSSIDQRLDEELPRFWEIEEIPAARHLSKEDELCDRLFLEGLRRGEDGRWIVRLPFKVDPASPNFLGESRRMVENRLMQVERRLSRNESSYDQYRKVLNEYIELRHMREATAAERADPRAYYLPHHAVIREDKTTTKVLVVFDASCKTTNGKSLNDRLHVGPTIQDDLFSLLIKWRKGKIV